MVFVLGQGPAKEALNKSLVASVHPCVVWFMFFAGTYSVLAKRELEVNGRLEVGMARATAASGSRKGQEN